MELLFWTVISVEWSDNERTASRGRDEGIDRRQGEAFGRKSLILTARQFFAGALSTPASTSSSAKVRDTQSHENTALSRLNRVYRDGT